MVRTGHSSREDTVVQLGLSNPEQARLGIEVLDYATLRHRLSPDLLNAVHRTDFHQLFRSVIDLLGAKGTILVVGCLTEGTRRFTELSGLIDSRRRS